MSIDSTFILMDMITNQAIMLDILVTVNTIVTIFAVYGMLRAKK